MTILNQRGNVLLFVIAGIAMIASIAMGMFYMTSTSTLGQVGGSGMNHAYYLALAGKDYALANWDSGSSITGEFILSDTERFDLSKTNFKITATGIVNKDTPFEAKKTIIALSPSPVRKHFLDTFENLSKWDMGTQVGGHTITPVSGDNALDVTSTQTGIFGSRPWSFIQLNTGSSGANVDLTTAWKDAGYCLSHDLQVKIRNIQPFHMEGLAFKVSSSGDTFYGVSYIRRKETSWDGSNWNGADDISNSLKPDAIYTGSLEYDWWTYPFIRYSHPAIILWKRQGGVFTWLAYKLMTYDVNNQNYVFNSSNLLIDWSNLQVRLNEAYSLDFSTGGPTPLLNGAIVVGPNGSARISGTPIIESGSWAAVDALGKLTLTTVSGTFQSGDNLLVNGVTRAIAAGAIGAKTNYIRVYYGDVNSHGTQNNIPTDSDNRGGNPRIVTGSSNVIHWPVDNVSDWSAYYDYMTLVQWDGFQASASRLGASGTKEENAIIEDNSLLTPDSGAINYSGIALHATGNTATSTYFDDFAIQY